MMTGSMQVCTFDVDRYWFAVPVAQVQEVIRSIEVTRVPLAPPVIRGIINLRGLLVSAIDLRVRLGLPPIEDVTGMSLCVYTPDGIASLLVDDIGEVRSIDRETFEAPPATTDASIRPFLSTVSKQKERLLLILDLDRIVELDSSGSSGRF